MKYLDKYPNCIGCPVKKWCGTMISCTRLCKSYRENKEETKMNYEERYNQALEIAKHYHDRDNIHFLEHIFPELRETEDERIRKEIIDRFKSLKPNFSWYEIPIDDILSWLEKQGEKHFEENIEMVNPSWSEEDEEMVDFMIEFIESIWWRKDLTQRKDNVLSWLKSLKPQNKWKPSEEQMEAIKYFIDFHRPQANASTEGWKEFENLERLYNNLLKL